MTESAIKERLRELTDLLSDTTASGKKKAPAAEGVFISDGPTSKASVESCVDRLQLEIKYLMFDLEATRRENRYLRQMLQGKSKDNGQWGFGNKDKKDTTE